MEVSDDGDDPAVGVLRRSRGARCCHGASRSERICSQRNRFYKLASSQRQAVELVARKGEEEK